MLSFGLMGLSSFSSFVVLLVRISGILLTPLFACILLEREESDLLLLLRDDITLCILFPIICIFDPYQVSTYKVQNVQPIFLNGPILAIIR